ncbi:RNA polymerase sigma factor [candidate division KSB1 bacterium]|nr:RNA polymerase sigma factor [candidate division KSB1 bacterium]
MQHEKINFLAHVFESKELRNLDSISDHELMSAVKNGDVDKLGLLFERYKSKLYNFYVKQIPLSQTCEDLVQDVFFRMLKYRHTYRGDSKFTTWMFRIARNVLMDHYRKHKHESDAEVIESKLIAADPNPEDLAQQDNEVRLLRKAIQRLPAKNRQILILSRYHNLTYAEISDIMSIKIGTIKAIVFRTLRELAIIYKELEGVHHEM